MGPVTFLILALLLFMLFTHPSHGSNGRQAGSTPHAGRHSMFWMLVVCLLPLLALFVLGGMGIVINPVLVLAVLLLGCAAMFFVGHGRPASDTEGDDGGEEDLRRAQDDQFIQVRSEIAEVFHARGYHVVEDTMVLEGRVLTDPEEVCGRLRVVLAGRGLVPMLEEAPGGGARLVLAPSPALAAAGSSGRTGLHALLFVLTLGTTTWAGAAHQGFDLLADPSRWAAGLPYALGLMLILGTHELGHYVAARRHGMAVSLPYFIPVPFALGTFGAFIQLKSIAQHRKALFDVGIAGPLAGLAVALPALFIGLRLSTPVLGGNAQGTLLGGMNLGSSALLAMIADLSIGQTLSNAHQVVLHPLAFAGWLGLLLTALNLLPIGQLDGGHVAHAVFGRRDSGAIGTAAMLGLVLLGLFVWPGLLTWAILVFFLAGRQGVGPMNDLTPVDRPRAVLGVAAFVLLFLILAPVPHTLYGAFGLHCPYL